MSSRNSANKFDHVVSQARLAREEREKSYLGRALNMYSWLCGRCSREFDEKNLQALTIHHRDHNHDNHPLDGSNWELLCIYCHANEHSRYIDSSYGNSAAEGQKRDNL